MKIKIAIGIASIGLITTAYYVGVAAGRARIASKDVSFNTVFAIALLENIHAGDTNRVITLLESWLDGNIYAMSEWRKSPFSSQNKDQTQKALARAATYRNDHPRDPFAAPEYSPDTHSEGYRKQLERQQIFASQMNQTIEALLEEGQEYKESQQQPAP